MLALALAAGVGLSSASAGEAPSVGVAGSLKWRARGSSPAVVKSASGVVTFRPVADQTAVAKKSSAPALLPPAKPREVARKTAARKPDQPLSTRTSRAKVRDSVLRVAAYQDEALPGMPADDVVAQATTEPTVESLLEPATTEPSASEPATTEPSTTEPLTTEPAAEPLRTEPSELPEPEPARSESGTEPIESPLGSKPAPLEPDTNLGDEPPGRSELPIPSGDLSEGISTKPGGLGCKDNAEQCIRAIRELQQRDITTIIAGVVIEGVEGEDFPCDCKIGRDYQSPKFAGRNFAPTLFTWKATGTCHKPLYFEDVQLERYGHSWNPVVQPFASAAHFFVSVPLLPYKMGLTPPNECMYTLGYYRPGNCAPYMFEPLPLSLRAALYEGAAATAFGFWFWPPH